MAEMFLFDWGRDAALFMKGNTSLIGFFMKDGMSQCCSWEVIHLRLDCS